VQPPAFLTDGAGFAFDAEVRVTLDGAGVAGTALLLTGPDATMRRARIRTTDLGSSVIAPAIDAALGLLAAGEFVGRCWCQIDLVGVPAALLLDEEGNKSPAGWVPTGGDLALPADDGQVHALARQAAYAYARSAGLPFWDRPVGVGSASVP
jgi:hypothetical protein